MSITDMELIMTMTPDEFRRLVNNDTVPWFTEQLTTALESEESEPINMKQWASGEVPIPDTVAAFIRGMSFGVFYCNMSDDDTYQLTEEGQDSAKHLVMTKKPVYHGVHGTFLGFASNALDAKELVIAEEAETIKLIEASDIPWEAIVTETEADFQASILCPGD
jgi:hypothetical protein